ncbi:MAG: glycosyltransferase [Rhizobiales bacterium]|nr:glycosyltransferase [Hyphomicrobiales bacterium]
MAARSRGTIDDISADGWLTGWALSANPARERATLAVSCDGKPIGSILADQFRQDLAEALGDANCAFWFRLPESVRDGTPRTIAVHFADTGEPLANSPTEIVVGVRPDADQPPPNLIANSDLTRWPNGVVVSPKERFTEIAAQWFFDYRQGTVPTATFSLAELNGISQSPTSYGLRAQFHAAPEGYARIIIPLDQAVRPRISLRFSCGFARPIKPQEGRLAIAEVFIATVADNHLVKLTTIRKNVSPRELVRLHDVGFEIATTVGTRLALVFDFKGAGEMILFDPVISETPLPKTISDGIDDFEDPNIRGQIDALRLSDIWQKGAVLATRMGETDAPRSIRPPQPAAIRGGAPFTQIVVPVFNALADVGDLLDSLVTHTTSPFEVLLLDDASGGFTDRMLSRWAAADPRIRLVRHDENIGYTANINFGLHLTNADYAVLMNSDVVVTPNWLEKLHEALAFDDQTAAVGPVSNAASWQSVPRAKTAGGAWAVNRLPKDTTPNDYAALVERLSAAAFPEFPLLNGFCTLFRRAALAQVGFFDAEAFPHGYGEENDVCIRLRGAGYRLRVADHCFLLHKKSKSFGHDRRQQLTKQSNETFRAKHPEVSVPALEAEMQSNAVLGTLRQELVAAGSVELQRRGRVIRIAAPGRRTASDLVARGGIQ